MKKMPKAVVVKQSCSVNPPESISLPDRTDEFELRKRKARHVSGERGSEDSDTDHFSTMSQPSLDGFVGTSLTEHFDRFCGVLQPRHFAFSIKVASVCDWKDHFICQFQSG